MTIEELTKGMNSKQAEAVRTTEGPLLIMAGAGSGKTRVLTHRVAHLIEDLDVAPWRILAITFTNKAAREMRERIGKLVDEQLAQSVWVSTFHALAVRILRRDGERIGLGKNFTILDSSAQKTLVKRVINDLNLDSNQYDPRTILGTISNAKNDLLTAKDYQEQAANFYEERVAEVYSSYQKALRQAQSVDFDDLIMLTIELFEKAPDVLQRYQDQFRYLHVDEYQDTNDAQYKIVNMLAQGSKNLAVVGDADQSIYGWRGANMQNILNFEKDWPEAKSVFLEQNYRSTQSILDAANDVINHNNERVPKKLWTENGVGDKITYYRAQSAQDEAYYVLGQIQKGQRENHKSLSDFAILYRTNAQSRAMEESLVKANIPYTIVGGHKFYDRKEILDIMAYLSLVANPADNAALERIINVPKRAIGQSTVDRLFTFANQVNLPMLAAIDQVEMAQDIRPAAVTKLLSFAEMVHNFRQQAEFLTVSELTDLILEQSGYRKELQAKSDPESQSRLENLDEFLSVTKEFDDKYDAQAEDAVNPLTDFLGSTALMADLDNVEEDSGVVTLMTLHAAKGLEFPTVFLIGLEEGLFPLGRAAQDEDQLEEERRLAYVGITRAEQKLYLTNAFSRLLYGRTQANQPSRFIDEISPELIEQAYPAGGSGVSSGLSSKFLRATSTTYQGAAKASPVQKKSAGTTGAEGVMWQAGDKVSHKKWGIGTVVSVTGDQADQELKVAFPEDGIKQLLAAFAPITRVD
ncbi:DNA helicase PcrA [Fructobacillus evanidus]|uniref:ATP-dependent DNA helicase n=1 Tax=Fructobacillus evanidus TaxID=3064281 RepID=A0ABM9MQQ9_9LACO|nr:Superfamily I DNA or RNA helicase (UvrD) [Fructobacillus sp. LMG 32999]CAK1231136.1 Superfamily I DNA or RNA helicase (UvrD) [Fructobacillus sp. LMG 32999]CAK1233492.1 Superfamily I DNA or RNA helicase (UvrD) [Fructobacillus sp. LMG 32999]CAK1237048.1 Superfamily I DNA or RNA helicase (UvrD) [Fructobacillus sp. LMG 32999]CAK1237504.1 Superfamily I DNA or RNA helicase (UvrD) [Fructobacillus sp. LMG 32999]